MANKLGAYSRLFCLTLILCFACFGGSLGYLLSMDAARIIAVLVTLGGALFVGLLVALVSAGVFASGMIGNDRQARIVDLSIWGTTALFVVVGTTVALIGEVSSTLLVSYTAFEILFGIVSGAVMGAGILCGKELRKC